MRSDWVRSARGGSRRRQQWPGGRGWRNTSPHSRYSSTSRSLRPSLTRWTGSTWCCTKPTCRQKLCPRESRRQNWRQFPSTGPVGWRSELLLAMGRNGCPESPIRVALLAEYCSDRVDAKCVLLLRLLVIQPASAPTIAPTVRRKASARMRTAPASSPSRLVRVCSPDSPGGQHAGVGTHRCRHMSVWSFLVIPSRWWFRSAVPRSFRSPRR